VSSSTPPGGHAKGAPRRSRRNKRARLQAQIEAVGRQLNTQTQFGRSHDSLTVELTALCARREALGPPEEKREVIEATQLRARHTWLRDRPTARPIDHRPVEDLAVKLAGPKQQRPTLTRHY
jgi:hypothetical protein